MNSLRYVSLGLMAALYIGAGIMHFAATPFFLQIMPAYIPGSWHLGLVYLSGVCEIGLGVLLLVPRWRPWAARGLILLLLAVFPANVNMAVHHIRPVGVPPWFPQATPLALWLRLAFQFVLIAWAWSFSRASAKYTPRKDR